LTFGFLRPWWTSPLQKENLPLTLPPLPKNLTWQVPYLKERKQIEAAPAKQNDTRDVTQHSLPPLQEEEEPKTQTLEDAVLLLDELVASGGGTENDSLDDLLGDILIHDPFDFRATSSATDTAKGSKGDESIDKAQPTDDTTNGAPAGRAGLMAAIAAKSAATAPPPTDASGADGRAGLMAAIASKSASTQPMRKKNDSGNGRAGLMAAIAAKSGSTPAEKQDNRGDGRAGLMAAIAAKASSVPPPKKTDSSDGRAGLMAAIAAKSGSTPAEKQDGRAGLMAAIAAKAGATPVPAEKDDSGDSRTNVMAAIAAKGNKDDKDDTRAGLMAAIAAKAGTVPPTEKKDDSVDSRAGLMAAIAAKAGVESPPTSETKDKSSDVGRSGLLAAIAGKATSVPKQGENVDGTISSSDSKVNDAKEIASEDVHVIEYDHDEPIRVAVSSTMSARVGDVYSALVPSAGSWDPTAPLPESLQERPILPLLPTIQQSLHLPLVGSLDQPSYREAVALLLKLEHAGVTLDDLTNLAQISQLEWNRAPPEEVKHEEKEAATDNASTLSNPNEAKGEDRAKSPEVKENEGGTPPPVEEEKKEDSVRKTDEDDASKPPMKKDSRFEKYFKMRSVGLPDGAIQNAMTRDDVDPSILALDWNRNYEDQTAKAAPTGDSSGSGGPPMKEDERFTKYWKMKGVGLPDGAIQNAMTRDGVDPTVLDLDWNKNYEAQTQSASSSSVPSGPPMKEDDRFAKYWKMKGVGLPDGAIQNAMTRDGVDPSALDLDWDKNFEAQTQPAGGDIPTGPPMKEDERFKKYWKMRSVGLPDGAVANAMMKDGLDPKAIDLDWDKNYESQTQPAGEEIPTGPPMKEDERFKKYWKMKSVGLPDGAVANAMMKDGLDAKAIELDWDKNYEAQTQPAGGGVDTGPPLKDDPAYAKYFKMLSVGLPPPVVQNAMTRDGIDPKILDLDPEKSVASQLKVDIKKAPIKKKKKVRRKKIYWTPIEASQIKDDSLWSIVKGRLSMKKLNYDVKEFEALFTESADPADKKKKEKKKGAAKKEKKAQQVIDGKRSMNGGIILARLRMAYNAIASMVDKMQMGSFDATQLMALKDFLPTSEEQRGLENYMGQAKGSEEKKQSLYADLSECEKYMHTMMGVEKANEKFDCMVYRAQFYSRFDELMESMKLIETACDEVRNSEKLQHLMTMILVLVNEINTGGESNGAAAGFNLEALLKLNEAKAFDKKTSVLHYLIKLVMHNDESLLGFYSDLKRSKEAVNVVLDSLVSDMKDLQKELDGVVGIAKEDAERAEKAGERTFSLQDLRGQRSSIHFSTAGVPQFNQIDHHTGRTPMERFTLQAGASIQHAIEFADGIHQKYVKLLEYFGEDLQMASDDFFRTLNSFVAEFSKAQQQVEKDEKAKKKAEAKRKKEEEKKKKEDEKKRLAEDKKMKEEAAQRGDNLVASLAFESGEPTADKTHEKDRSNRAGLMSAIAAKAAGPKEDGDSSGRAGLMAAIAAKDNSSGETEDTPGDGRAGLMAAIAAKGNAPKKAGPGDGRAGLMAAIAAKDNSSGETEDTPGDGRAGLMAAIAAKGISRQSLDSAIKIVPKNDESIKSNRDESAGLPNSVSTIESAAHDATSTGIEKNVPGNAAKSISLSTSTGTDQVTSKGGNFETKIAALNGQVDRLEEKIDGLEGQVKVAVSDSKSKHVNSSSKSAEKNEKSAIEGKGPMILAPTPKKASLADTQKNGDGGAWLKMALSVKTSTESPPKSSPKSSPRSSPDGGVGFMAGAPPRGRRTTPDASMRNTIQKAESKAALFDALAEGSDEGSNENPSGRQSPSGSSSEESGELNSADFDDIGSALPVDLGPLGSQGEEITKLKMSLVKKPQNRRSSMATEKPKVSSDTKSRRFSAL